MRWIVLAIALASGGSALADWGARRDPFDPAVALRYEQILARDPYDASALAHLETMFRSFRTAAALDAIYASSTDHAGLVVRARLHRDRRDLPVARDLFVEAVALDPTDLHGWLAIAELARTLGSDRDARTAYAAAVALDPPAASSEPALRALIQLARNGAELEDAEAQLIALAPHDGARWLARGEAELSANLVSVAIASFAAAERELASDLPRRLTAIAEHGETLERAHDDRGAIADYRRAIALAPRGYFLVNELRDRLVDVHRRLHELPDLTDAFEHEWRVRGYAEWALLGSLYAELDNTTRALDAWRHALAIAPGELATAHALIALYDRLNDPKAAYQVYLTSARAAPGATDFQLELVHRAFLRHDDATAFEVLSRLEARSWYDAGLLRDLGDLDVEHARFKAGERVLERAVKLEPDDEQTWVALAGSYAAAGDPEAAIAAWKRVAKPRPRALDKLGEILLDHEAYGEAAQVFGDAVAADGTDAAALTGRAWALDGIGSTDEALADAQRAVQLMSDAVSRRGARHVVVQIFHRAPPHVQERLWWQLRVGWLEALEDTPPDLDAGHLLLDIYDGMSCEDEATECSLLASALRILEKIEPDDEDVLAATVRVATWDNDMNRAERARARLLQLHPERIAAIRVVDGPPDDPHVDDDRPPPPPTGVRAALEVPLWLGPRVFLSGSGGPMGISLGIGASANLSLGPRAQVVTRADAVYRDGPRDTTPNAFGASIGLDYYLVVADSFAIAFGAGERTEVRTGLVPDRTWDRVGAALEAELDLVERNAHAAPPRPHQKGMPAAGFSVDARIQQWIAGGLHDTSFGLDLTVWVR